MMQFEKIYMGVAEGDFLLLAKAVSQIENNTADAALFLQSLLPQSIPIIGITGPPGAGKSTLINALIATWVHDAKILRPENHFYTIPIQPIITNLYQVPIPFIQAYF